MGKPGFTFASDGCDLDERLFDLLSVGIAVGVLQDFLCKIQRLQAVGVQRELRGAFLEFSSDLSQLAMEESMIFKVLFCLSSKDGFMLVLRLSFVFACFLIVMKRQAEGILCHTKGEDGKIPP